MTAVLLWPHTRAQWAALAAGCICYPEIIPGITGPVHAGDCPAAGRLPASSGVDQGNVSGAKWPVQVDQAKQGSGNVGMLW